MLNVVCFVLQKKRVSFADPPVSRKMSYEVQQSSGSNRLISQYLTKLAPINASEVSRKESDASSHDDTSKSVEFTQPSDNVTNDSTGDAVVDNAAEMEVAQGNDDVPESQKDIFATCDVSATTPEDMNKSYNDKLDDTVIIASIDSIAGGFSSESMDTGMESVNVQPFSSKEK